MITHYKARQLLVGLEGDPETLKQLAEYIRAQERGPADFEALSEREHAIRAANRAVEAISRVATLTSDLARANAHIVALEDRVTALEGALIEIVELIEARFPSS